MALPPAMPHICAPVIESGPGAAPLDSVGLNCQGSKSKAGRSANCVVSVRLNERNCRYY